MNRLLLDTHALIWFVLKVAAAGILLRLTTLCVGAML